MKLSIIIPVYNEENTILGVIAHARTVALDTALSRAIGDSACAGFEREIVVVDDASTDGTLALLGGLRGKAGVVVISHSRNRGKGAAVRTGLQYASGDIVLIQDADLEYDPSDYPRLLQPIVEGEAQVVYGSRFLGGRPAGMSTWYTMGNRFLTSIANHLHRCLLTDVLTCYKVFTREVAAQLELRATRWAVDAEITAQVLGLGYAIHEVPIFYHARTLQEGKKIRWQDGLSILGTLIRYALSNSVKAHRRIEQPEEYVVAGELRGHQQA
jgi:glycosyltransferase involved in cell wall biosynthesis